MRLSATRATTSPFCGGSQLGRTPAVQAANIEDMAHIGAQMLTCDEFCMQGLASVRDVAAEVAVAVRGPRA